MNCEADESQSSFLQLFCAHSLESVICILALSVFKVKAPSSKVKFLSGFCSHRPLIGDLKLGVSIVQVQVSTNSTNTIRNTCPQAIIKHFAAKEIVPP